LKVLEGSKIARGRKKRTNIKKQVVRKPVTLNQTIWRRFLLIGGSGRDSTTTAALAGALAGAFGAGGLAAFAGGAESAELCGSKLLSTSLRTSTYL
jgi:hypothetical protein